MEACPACDATTTRGRFCGTCGHRLNAQVRPSSVASGVPGALAGSADRRGEPTELHVARAPEPGHNPLRLALAIAVAIAFGSGSLVLRPTPEVVDAGRWRGDGTGTTSTQAADPQRIVWITPRPGLGPTDGFRQDHVIPVGAHEDLGSTSTRG